MQEHMMPYSITDPQERTWGMFCHLSALIGWIVIPYFGKIIGPLLVWLLLRNQYPFVDDQGRESLNFQISVTIYEVIFFAASILIGVFTLGLGLFLVVPIAIILVLVEFILLIIATVTAYDGRPYRYPFTIRFV
jgi:uncharacterized Tic20 family protein